MNSREIQKLFGQSVKKYRKEKGFTQEKLSELIDKDPSTVARIESGTNFVNCETFAMLCDVLDVTPAMLLSPTEVTSEDETLEAITQFLQTVPANNLKDVYKMLLLLSKYFT